MLILSIRDKNGEERRLQFDKEEVTIGRTQGSDIVLPRNNISKRHARLVDKDDKIVVVDLRSTNGTYVNGRRITAPEILTSEDKVYIGDFVLKVMTEVEASQPQPPASTHPGPPPAPVSTGPTEHVGAAAAAMEVEATAAIDLSQVPDDTAADLDDWVEVDIDFDGGGRPAKAPVKTVAQMPAASYHAPEPADLDLLDAADALDDLDAIEPYVATAQPAAPEPAPARPEPVQPAPVAARPATPQPGVVAAAPVDTAPVGLGRLDELLADEAVQEIHVNGYDQVRVIRSGRAEEAPGFAQASDLDAVVAALSEHLGHVPGDAPTMFNGNLRSGASVEVIRPPVAPAGPVVVIRRPRAQVVTPQSLVTSGGLTEAALGYLADAIAKRRNVVVSGRTGGGRTTVMNALAYFVPSHERVALVEHVRELRLPHGNVVRLDKDHLDAHAEDLAGLLPRLKVDRALLDEVAGSDVYGFVTLALSGHDGLFAVMTSGSAHKLLQRMALELELVSGARLDDRARAMVAQAVDVIVHVERDGSGGPRVVEIVEVEAATPEGFRTREILSRS